MEQDVLKYLSDKYPVSNTTEIKEQINDELDKWKTAVHRKLQIENPYFKNQEQLANSYKSFKKNQYDVNSLERDYQGYCDLSKISNRRIERDSHIQNPRNIQKRAN
jgi:hypothetical protein